MQIGMSEDKPIRLQTLTGEAIRAASPSLARLRTIVFRDWPYLYDGDEEYERGYFATYAESARAAVVVARAGDEVVGASTCLPLTDETAAVQAPFQARGWDPARFFYFGESVLLSAYRGHGIGVSFFERREAHARGASACDYACFCSVVRPRDHPARPPDALPLDAFWRKRGYRPYPDLTCRMRWKDVGNSKESEHDLTFWMKPLRSVPLP